MFGTYNTDSSVSWKLFDKWHHHLISALGEILNIKKYCAFLLLAESSHQPIIVP